MSQPHLIATTPRYFQKLLDWRGVPYLKIGSLFKIDGHTDYNNLVDINSIFSTSPKGDPIDRTKSISTPYKYKIFRPIERFNLSTLNINEILEIRVKQLLSKNKKIHLFWSGGIDSTAVVSAFLQHTSNIDQLELIYTPFSLYENKDFFEFICKTYPLLKTIDISGDIYLHHQFPGLIITGHGGDEYTGSLDKSFFDSAGSNLSKSWKDYWYKKQINQSLIDFTEWFFSKANRPITTLFEARWWFYSNCKSQYFSPNDVIFTANGDKVDVSKLISFYDFHEFENYMHNDPNISIDDPSDYTSYKKFLRRYIFQFYKNSNYLNNYTKVDSVQYVYYREKKLELNDQRWIALLEDGSIIKTKNLPLLSKKEFYKKYNTSLDYLFN